MTYLVLASILLIAVPMMAGALAFDFAERTPVRSLPLAGVVRQRNKMLSNAFCVYFAVFMSLSVAGLWWSRSSFLLLFSRIRDIISTLFRPFLERLSPRGALLAMFTASLIFVLAIIGIAGGLWHIAFDDKTGENQNQPTSVAASKENVDQANEGLFRSYRVDKHVSEFSLKPDFTTPEAAYATIMRDYVSTGASGKEWSNISVQKFSTSGDDQKVQISFSKASAIRNAYIAEVLIFRDRLAQITAVYSENGASGYDQRYLFLHKGRWLNSGQGELAPTVEAARSDFVSRCERIFAQDCETLGETVPSRFNRSPVENPQMHMQPYIGFLQEHARAPHAFIIESLKTHELVAIGEVHNRPVYWAFNSALVRDPAFAKAVGTIYLELPANHQETVDQFLAGDTPQPELIIAILQDMTTLGWPCQATLDFFMAVWETNQKLSPAKHLRICLVDTSFPWEKIRSAADWSHYSVDRDLFMAENILADRQRSQTNQRHGLFIAGMGHIAAGLYYADQQTPIETAGWHLRQALGDDMLVVFQHAPVVTNSGAVEGRLALGLLDTAFAELDNLPVAFSLRDGPFGQLPFDGMPDKSAYGDFRDGADAYLFLAELDSESLSPLIEGFYSQEYVAEIRRRLHLSGQSPAADRMTREALLDIRRLYWGKPRWAGSLGPKNAWQLGEEWQTRIEQQRMANIQPQELTTILDNIYRGITHINDQEYDISGWGRRFGFSYQTMTNWPGMVHWWREVLQRYPLKSVEYGPLERTEEGLPRMVVVTRLEGGIQITGTFVFKYLPLRDTWQARYGLDMHLDEQWKELVAHSQESPLP